MCCFAAVHCSLAAEVSPRGWVISQTKRGDQSAAVDLQSVLLGYVADYNATYNMLAFLRSRPWNSHDSGTLLASGYSNTTNSDTTINMALVPAVAVNNQTTEYWIDVNPLNDADPGQLCVYGIQVTYTIDGSFLPLIQRGG